MIKNTKRIMKFNHVVNHFHVLNDISDRIGIVYEFHFDNGLGVSIADHNEISGNETCDCVSAAIVDPSKENTAIVSDNERLDDLFGLQQGVKGLDRDEIRAFLTKVKNTSVLDFI